MDPITPPAPGTPGGTPYAGAMSALDRMLRASRLTRMSLMDAEAGLGSDDDVAQHAYDTAVASLQVMREMGPECGWTPQMASIMEQLTGASDI